MIADVAVFALSQVVLFYGFKVSAQYRAVVLVCLHIHRGSADACSIRFAYSISLARWTRQEIARMIQRDRVLTSWVSLAGKRQR